MLSVNNFTFNFAYLQDELEPSYYLGLSLGLHLPISMRLHFHQGFSGIVPAEARTLDLLPRVRGVSFDQGFLKSRFMMSSLLCSRYLDYGTDYLPSLSMARLSSSRGERG